MKNIYLVFIGLALFAFSCKEKSAEKKEVIVEETEAHSFMVKATNEAWANAEELNKRVSPPKSVMAESENGLKMAVHYSAPFVKNRSVWDSLVPYNELWRTGANEATIIEFSHDVKIEDNIIPAGSYSLFSIPKSDKFTVIFNKDTDQWGAYEYNEKEDVVRFDVPSLESDFSEALKFDLKGENKAITLNFKWENKGFEFSASRAKN